VTDPGGVLLDREQLERAFTALGDRLVRRGVVDDVIGAFLGHPERGGAIWIFSNDTAAIRALIPRFTAVVLDMIERGLIEVREPPDAVWDSAPALTIAEVNARSPIRAPGSGQPMATTAW
jgi:hypothetical protein